MKQFKKIFAVLLFMPLFLIAHPIKKHEKTKTISKKFKVNSNATVFIQNKYGTINVSTWDKNNVEIDVKITVKGKNEDKVEEKLKAINIDFEASESLVEARTIIESVKSSWSWWGSNNNNLSYKINYYVKMPVTNNADLNNKYGSIDLDVLEGKANINCDYGSIQIDKLMNSNNTIELDYCSSSDIRYMKSGSLNVDYSKITIDKTDNIKVNADYSGVKIGNSDSVDFNCDYGSISIKDAYSVDGSSDYAGMKIGKLRESLKIDTDYGGLRVSELVKGFKEVVIDGNYAGIKIGTAADNNFNFSVDLGYASFNYPEEYTETFKSIKKSTKKYYEGVFGKGNSKSSVRIRSNYGGVSLKIVD
ncbi:hypothetical protein ACOSP6_07190 [Tenacibaculum sp. MEBiC06402]|uniref:hypothetical protein n=1 Tax=unclassified Tenacibaculum TaxID=2635139 RepID=UPI003B9AC648